MSAFHERVVVSGIRIDVFKTRFGVHLGCSQGTRAVTIFRDGYFERGAADRPPKKRKNQESGGNTSRVLLGCSAAS